MYSLSDLQHEIADIVEDLKQDKTQWLHPDWITQEVLNQHLDVVGDDSDFYLVCSRPTVREEVRRYLNRYKLKPTTDADRQFVLPGFKRVQTHYLVDRDGQQVAIHIDFLAEADFDAKCQELESMAEGCLEHRDELRRYQQAKKAQAA